MGSCKGKQRKRHANLICRVSKKKQWLSILLAALMICIQPFEAFAYEPAPESVQETVGDVQTANVGTTFAVDNIRYEVTGTDTVKVIGYESGLSGALGLGWNINQACEACVSYENVSYHITAVGDYALKDSNITSVTFSPYITEIGTGVLEGCSSLTQVYNGTSIPISLPEVLGYLWRGEDADVYITTTTVDDQNGARRTSSLGTCQVTFYLNDGSGAVYDSQEITKNTKVTKPADPVRSGYTFGGWYNDATQQTSTHEYEFPDKETSNILSLYARWIQEPTLTQLCDGYSSTDTFSNSVSSWYAFTPNAAGTYVFTLGSSTYLRAYFHGTSYDVNSSSTYGTEIRQELSAGNTYYYRVYLLSSSTDASKTALITFHSVTEAKNVSDLTITISPTSYTYDGKAKTPGVTVQDGTTVLNAGTDYTLAYSDNMNAGTGTVTITGTGTKYTGSVTKMFTIGKAVLTNIPSTAMTVDNTVATVGDVSLSAYPGWSWSNPSQALTAGGTVSATAVYQDTANYTNPTVTVQITRGAKDISSCTVSGVADSYTYTTNAIKPTVTVKDGTTVLVQDTDYTVSYSNNTDVGTAAITITGKGAYKGNLTKTFAIKRPAVETITLNQDKVELSLNGTTTATLSVTAYTPSLAEKPSVTWSSSNPSAATVDSNSGYVTAVAAGKTTVTATAANGVKATCEVTVSNPIQSFTLSENQLALVKGNPGRLEIIANPVNADSFAEVTTWTVTSGADVIAVTPATDKKTAAVQTLKAGTATITVSVNGCQSQTCIVNVTEPSVTLESITVSPETKSLVMNQEGFWLTVSPTPSNAALGTVTYTSSSDCISVDEKGYVTANKSGTATITVTASGAANAVDYCYVTVTNPLTGFDITADNSVITVGDTSTLTVTNVTPAGADAYTLEWSSSSDSVAAVSGNNSSATVNALQAGTAIITATDKGTAIKRTYTITVQEKPEIKTVTITNGDGTIITLTADADGKITLPAITEKQGHTAQWKVTSNGQISYYNAETKIDIVEGMRIDIVYTPILVSAVSLTAANFSVKVGESVKAVVQVTPADAYNKNIQWSTSNGAVATVDNSGNIKGIAAGTAQITATAADGSGKTAVATVTVTDEKQVISNPEESEPIKVSSLKITADTKKVAPGKKLALKVTVSPSNAANKNVTWSVSNSKYASVSSTGVVTTKTAGKGKSVTITATSKDNSAVKATYKITIMKNAVKKIKLSGKKTLKKGKTAIIKATFTPAKNISKELTWTSSNPKIATVSSKGKVKALKKGKVKITAKAKDGSGKKATITITVK